MLCILECTCTVFFCCEALLWLVCACEGFAVLGSVVKNWCAISSVQGWCLFLWDLQSKTSVF